MTVERILTSLEFNGQVLNLRELGYIACCDFEDKKVTCVINVTLQNKSYIKTLAKFLDRALRSLPEVETVNIAFTGEQLPSKLTIPNVKQIILVSSGKGGVGKSTVAYLMALRLAETGARVGLVDVDIHGPSLPTLTKIFTKPKVEDGYMIPHAHKSLQVNSIGYLINEDESLVWRGPMLVKAMNQLLQKTRWSDLDFLIVDMPPGTGDVHLGVAEKYAVSGVVLVTTPQLLALPDLRRTLNMYTKLKLNILGVIENMSHLLDSQGNTHALYSEPVNIEGFCRELGVPFLERIPLCQDVKDLRSYPHLIKQCIYGYI
jgi:ATP-binding protein involved in chromosome partitioning